MNIVKHGVMLLILLSACTFTTTDMLLEGNFGNIDRSPPIPITPIDARVAGLDYTLTWVAPAGASSYDLEISTEVNFANHMTGSPFKVKTSNAAVKFSDAFTYYWRVRANTTDVGRYSEVRRIHVLGGAVRVHCANGVAVCSNANLFGTKSSPYQVIQDSLADAKVYGVEVHVAARGAGAHYDEVLDLLAGVTVRGGYSAADWSRNISGNETIVRRDSLAVVSARNLIASSNFWFDGFTVNNTRNTASFHYALYIEGGNNRLQLTNNKIIGGGGSNSFGIFSFNASAAVLSNTVNGGTATTATALGATNSNLTITGNNLTGGSGGTFCYGYNGSASGGTLSGNTILGGICGTPRGVHLTSSSSPTISGNTITGGSGSGAVGVNVLSTSNPLLYNNLIYSGPPGVAVALSNSLAQLRNNTIYSVNGGALSMTNSAPVISNNIFVLSGSYSGFNRVAISEDATSNPTVFTNNNVVDNGVGGGFVFYADGTTGNRTNAADLNNPSLTAQGGAASGNVNISNAAGQLFANVPKFDVTRDGPDAGTTYGGSTTTLEVADCADGRYVNGEYIEYDGDGVSRQITSVNCTGTTSIITFSPASSSSTVVDREIRLWGTNNTNLQLDWGLASPSLNTCNAAFGALDFSAQYAVDRSSSIRTATMPSSGPCNGQVTNTGSTGWSMGAYERD